MADRFSRFLRARKILNQLVLRLYLFTYVIPVLGVSHTFAVKDLSLMFASGVILIFLSFTLSLSLSHADT